MSEATLLGAFLVGLLGSTHCLGMCGGLAAAMGQQRGKAHLLLAYNAGRLLTYTVLGAVAGLLGMQVLKLAPGLTLALRTLAGLLVIAMGLYVCQWWMGLTRLEQLGAALWRRLQPLVKGLLPVQHTGQALLLGGLWGLLPCGLVYSTLTWAVANANWVHSALLMLAFGLGTAPAMVGVGLMSQGALNALRRPWVRRLAGGSIIVMGIWTAAMPWLHKGMDHGAQVSPVGNEHAHH